MSGSSLTQTEVYFNPFPHEFSCYAPPTMDNYVNKLSCWYIEQRNYLSGTPVSACPTKCSTILTEPLLEMTSVGSDISMFQKQTE